MVKYCRKKETSGNVPDILEQGIKRGKNYVVLTMRLAMIFSMTRLPFGEGLECDHLYENFIHGSMK